MHTQIWSREGTNFMEFRKVIYDFVLKNHGSYLVSHFQEKGFKKYIMSLLPMFGKSFPNPWTYNIYVEFQRYKGIVSLNVCSVSLQRILKNALRQ